MSYETEALAEAIKEAGGQRALGAHLGVGQSLVWYWLNKAKRLPAEHVLRTEELTGVARWDLRPDLYPAPEYSEAL